MNRSYIFKHLVHRGPLSRTQLVQLTGLTSGAVSRITGELIAAGMLEEGEAPPSKGKVGPRFIALDIAKEGGYVLGLGLEASSQEIALANLRGTLLARRTLKLLQLSDARSVAATIAKAAWQLVSDKGVPVDRIFGLGAAVIGIVDPAQGLILESPYLKWKKSPFGDYLHSEIGIPVYVDGLLHALNLAEVSQGNQLTQSNVIYIHTTLGLGASILADGNLLRGEARAAGQIGHIRVTTPIDDQLRAIPLATLSSGRAILSSLGYPTHELVDYRDFASDLSALKRVLKAGLDTGTREAAAIQRAGEHLGEYIGGLCGVLNPERIALGGILGRHPAYLQGVAEGMSHQTLVPENYQPELTVSEMDSTLAGALLARNSALLTDGFDLPPFEQISP